MTPDCRNFSQGHPKQSFSYVSLGNALKSSHARRGNPPSQLGGTLSACPRHPSKMDIFLPRKQFELGYAGWPRWEDRENMASSSLTSDICSTEWQWIWREQCNKQWKASLEVQVIQKMKLATKTFLLSVILVVVLSGLSRDSPLAIPLSKGGLRFKPPSRVTRSGGAPPPPPM